MAYHCSGDSNDELVQKMVDNHLITEERVAAAFRKVDRANYVVDKRDAYRDSPQAIKCNATISAPHMHAYAAESLLPFLKPGARVLDVGSGSGYTCALFHHLISSPESPPSAPSEPNPSTSTPPEPPQPTPGKVIGIDHMPALVTWSAANLAADGLAPVLAAGAVEIVCGDGREGWAAGAPFDAIHVGAAAPGPDAPGALVEQLRSPGRMFIPVGDDSGRQRIVRVDKDAEGHVTETPILDVMYIPLTDRESQMSGRF